MVDSMVNFDRRFHLRKCKYVQLFGLKDSNDIIQTVSANSHEIMGCALSIGPFHPISEHDDRDPAEIRGFSGRGLHQG